MQKFTLTAHLRAGSDIRKVAFEIKSETYALAEYIANRALGQIGFRAGHDYTLVGTEK